MQHLNTVLASQPSKVIGLNVIYFDQERAINTQNVLIINTARIVHNFICNILLILASKLVTAANQGGVHVPLDQPGLG